MEIPLSSPPLLFVSLEDWDDLWRRNQFVCAELARRAPTRPILFVGLPRRVLRLLRSGDWRTLFRPPTWRVPGHPNLTVTTPLALFPDRFRWGRRGNDWLFRRHVWRVTKSLDLRAPLLWLNPHTAHHLIGHLDEAAVVYDVTDDWELAAPTPALAAEIRAQDAALGARADAIIVCSPALLAAKRAKFSCPVHLVPNGVDAAHYASVTDPTLPLPPPTRAWTHPVLGYTGTIHSARVDLDLVAALAARFPTGTVALIGPDHLAPADRQRLAAYPNVHLPGPVPYRDVPAWMRAVDVCIVPHRVTPFTESLNPIKLWEYLAAGKPIVSTPVAGFRDFPALVRLADTPDAFARAIQAAIAEGDTLLAARRAEALAHSWTSRVDQIEAILQSCLARRAGSAAPGSPAIPVTSPPTARA